jgi:outer membrane protein TolC
MQLQMNRSKFIPRLNAFGQYNLNDTKIFGKQANSYLVGLSLNWKVFDGGNNIAQTKKSKALLIKSNIELEKTKQEASLELSRANRSVTMAKNKLEMLDVAIEESEESYRLTNDSFLVGKETVDKLLIAEMLRSKKKLEYHLALFQYYIALSNVELQSK